MQNQKLRGKRKMTYADLLDKLIEENKRLAKENQELKNKIKELAQSQTETSSNK